MASELGVSTRTALRDLDRLRGRGFEISSMTGPGGGVHLEPTSVLVTSALAGEDVVALIVSAAVEAVLDSVVVHQPHYRTLIARAAVTP